MSEEEIHKFSEEGYFTIRRTDKFWSGIWIDMTIEQVLMKSLKSAGGMTHGRGITESTISQWVLSAPYCSKVIKHVKEFNL